MNVPVVIDRDGQTDRVIDIYSRLMQDQRVLYLSEQVNEETSRVLVGQFLYLSSMDPQKDITFYINSPGGSITAGLAIYDIMQAIPNDVRTVCIGQAASMGAMLLTAGTKGKRYALPNSRIMIHQPLAGVEGTAVDIEIHARELLKVKQRMNELLAKHTGQPIEKIEEDTDRDNFLTPEESREYGLIDHVIETAGELFK